VIEFTNLFIMINDEIAYKKIMIYSQNRYLRSI